VPYKRVIKTLEKFANSCYSHLPPNICTSAIPFVAVAQTLADVSHCEKEVTWVGRRVRESGPSMHEADEGLSQRRYEV